jgi:hypothetical protein
VAVPGSVQKDQDAEAAEQTEKNNLKPSHKYHWERVEGRDDKKVLSAAPLRSDGIGNI